MKHSQSLTRLSKFLAYILGRQPDEFGLLPDTDGYVAVKDLMKVLAEESGWRHVRLNQIREIIHTTRPPVIEMHEKRIRAVDRSHLFAPQIAGQVPKLLYYPIRRRAYPVVHEKGRQSEANGNRLILTDDVGLARRLGRRIDPSPIVLTVNTGQARNHGATIWCFGRHLFLLDRLPSGCFSGPPLARYRPVLKKEAQSAPQAVPKTPGSYLIDLAPAPPVKAQSEKTSRRRKNEWKRERKRKSRGDPKRGI